MLIFAFFNSRLKVLQQLITRLFIYHVKQKSMGHHFVESKMCFTKINYDSLRKIYLIGHVGLDLAGYVFLLIHQFYFRGFVPAKSKSFEIFSWFSFLGHQVSVENFHFCSIKIAFAAWHYMQRLLAMSISRWTKQYRVISTISTHHSFPLYFALLPAPECSSFEGQSCLGQFRQQFKVLRSEALYWSHSKTIKIWEKGCLNYGIVCFVMIQTHVRRFFVERIKTWIISTISYGYLRTDN